MSGDRRHRPVDDQLSYPKQEPAQRRRQRQPDHGEAESPGSKNLLIDLLRRVQAHSSKSPPHPIAGLPAVAASQDPRRACSDARRRGGWQAQHLRSHGPATAAPRRAISHGSKRLCSSHGIGLLLKRNRSPSQALTLPCPEGAVKPWAHEPASGRGCSADDTRVMRRRGPASVALFPRPAVRMPWRRTVCA